MTHLWLEQSKLRQGSVDYPSGRCFWAAEKVHMWLSMPDARKIGECMSSVTKGVVPGLVEKHPVGLLLAGTPRPTQHTPGNKQELFSPWLPFMKPKQGYHQKTTCPCAEIRAVDEIHFAPPKKPDRKPFSWNLQEASYHFWYF